MANTRVQLFVEYNELGSFQEAGIGTRLERQRDRLTRLRREYNAHPIFTLPADELLEEQARLEADESTSLPDLTRWIRVTTESEEEADALETALRRQQEVARVHRPTYLGKHGRWHELKTKCVGLSKSTARPLQRLLVKTSRKQSKDRSMDQRYLLSAPWGTGVVDVPGWPRVNRVGDIRIGVVDDYWNRYHVDLAHVRLHGETGVMNEVNDHGTNAVGILFATKDRKGLMGFATGAELVFAYPYTRLAGGGLTYSVADAISRAASLLRGGDVLLIERQIAFKAVERVRVCHDAIRHATAKGIVVIEPAGNGGFNLDDANDDGNAVDLASEDSGAIMVGAGLESSPQRYRYNRAPADKSCFGRRVDVQAFGLNVLTTAGRGPLGERLRGLRRRSSQPEPEKIASGKKGDEAFTYGFNGTSSASAIVAGAMAVACSVVKSLDPKGEPLPPAVLRDLIVQTGSPQTLADSPGKHIGPQPNLPALIRAIREALYERHQVALPQGDKPNLTAVEKWLVSLLGSGLPESDIAEELQMDEAKVRRIWSEVSAKLEAETPLAMARSADHWGIL